MELHDNLDKAIVISSPYVLNKTKQALSQFISDSFTEESMLFCCDIIMEFVAANKQYIHRQIIQNNKSDKNEPNDFNNKI